VSDPAAPGLQERLRDWANRFRRETYALYLAYRDPRVPRYAQLFAAAVVADAFSPIDLIPDPIPVLGYLDDLLLVPAGIWLALRLIPADVMIAARREASAMMARGERPMSRTAGVVIVILWVLVAVTVGFWLWRLQA
jgi:uncharacterized membrane protein YkvA (DUF1232 family)